MLVNRVRGYFLLKSKKKGNFEEFIPLALNEEWDLF
jgi:hypothetical protein